jgi:hypothetical protein
MMLEQGRRRLGISDGYVPGAVGCRKIDVIEFIAMARERGRESSSKFKTGRGAIRGRFIGRVLSERFGRSQNRQFVLISMSLVSGRKKKPTTAVIDAKMIGYHRPA